jgi:hypothetical protein
MSAAERDNGVQTEPVMDGATEATNSEKLSGLVEQVEQDHGHEGAGAMADHLRDRMAETATEPEDPATEVE